MQWFVTAANRLNHVDIYRWDGQDLTLARRIPTSRTLKSPRWTTAWSAAC